MPNIKELRSINDESLINPSINQFYFSGVNVNHYWSSTSLPNQTTKAWYFDTHFGITTYEFKTNKLYLLCVRGGNLITGINENSIVQNNVTISPNPSKGIITIVSENNIDEFKITDIRGQVIFQATPKAKYITLKLSTEGIFIITTFSGKIISTQKFLISN